MKKKILSLALASGTILSAQSYPPQAGEAGSTAIHKDSNVFVAWASQCDVTRGYMDIARPDMGKASFGTPENGTGKANGNLVSLGDGGVAVLTFTKPIKNGEGADFAIFENGFISNQTKLAFLELAFVEVSSDGVNYFRFPSINEYPEDFIENAPDAGGSGFASMDARYLHNFAGKYISNYGTPFDLDEIPDNALLNKQAITHIKIIDVVGTNKEPHRTQDSRGNIAIDPYPTPFHTSGFDLDAVGVIHQNENLSTHEGTSPKGIGIYPNPATDFIQITNASNAEVEIYTLNGKLIQKGKAVQGRLALQGIKTGVYLVKVFAENRNFTSKLIVK